MTHAIVFGGAIAFASLLLTILRSWQINAPEPSDRAVPPKVIFAIPVVIGALFAARACWGFFADNDVQWLVIFALGAAAVVLFLPALTRSEVFVSDGRVSGPASLIGPFTWYRRNTIRISDIRATGSARYDFTYFESGDGRRVYVGNSYPGARSIIDTLNSARAAERPSC